MAGKEGSMHRLVGCRNLPLVHFDAFIIFILLQHLCFSVVVITYL